MTRQVTDSLYIDLGYFTPENYFVYQANAQLTATSSGTLTVSIGKQVSASSSLTTTATISCDALRLRTILGDAALSSTATVSSSAVKTAQADSNLNSAFTHTTTGYRIIQGEGAFTGAFTPTLNIDVFKNHTAILDAVFSTVTVGVVNRATSITVDTIAALDAQAAKTVDVQSNQTSSATISIQAVTTKSAISTLTSTGTLVCEAFNVQFASAQMSVGSSIFTTRYFGQGRPFNLTKNGGGTLTFTTDSKFGSYALLDDAVVFEKGTPLINGYDRNQMVVQGWIKPLDTNSTGIIISPGLSTGGPFDLFKNGASIRFRTFYNVGGNRNTGTTLTTPDFTANTWYHWAAVFDGTYFAFFWNGTRIGGYGSVTDLWNTSVTNDTFRIQSKATDWIVDEVSVHKDTTLGYDPTASTITVPTTAGTNNDSTTLALWHFENNGLDDTSVGNQTGSASLSVQATLTAQAQEISAGSATLSSTVTVSVIGSLLNVASANLTNSSTLTAVIGQQKDFASAVNSAFTVVTSVVKTASIDSNPQADTDLTSTVTRIQSATVNLSDAFTPTLTVDVLKNHTAVLDAVCSVTAQINGNFASAANLSAVSTFVCGITKITVGSIDIASVSAVSVEPTKLPSTGADLSAQASLSAIIGLRQQAQGAFTSTAAVTTSAERLRGMISTQSATATWNDTVPSVYRNLGDQTLTASSTVLASVTNRIGFIIALTSTATMNTVAVKSTDTASNQSTAFSQNTVAAKTVDPLTVFSSIATQLTGIGYNATGTILLEAQASLSAIIGSIKSAETPSVSGIMASRPRWVQYIASINNGLNDGTLVAFWGRKVDPVSGIFIWNRERSWELFPQGTLPDGENYNRFYHVYAYINRTTFQFSGYNEQGPAGNASLTAQFTNAIPDDLNWHHYAVYWEKFQPNSIGNGYIIRLYIDGTQAGVFTSLAPANARITGTWYHPLDLGYNSNVEIGQLAVWGNASNFIINSNQNLDLDLYNNGYVELGSQGTVNSNTPYIYDRLDLPFSANIRGAYNNHLSPTGINFSDNARLEQYYTLTDQDQAEYRLYGNQAFFSLSSSILGVFLSTANLAVSTAMTCVASKAVIAQALITSTSSVTADPAKTAVYTVNLAATHSLDADVNLAPAGGAALMDHQSTLTAIVGYLQSQSSTLTSTVTVTAEAMVIPPISGDALLTVFANQSTVAGYLISSQSNLAAAFTQSTEGTTIDPVRASGTLSVDTALVCAITRVRPGISLEMSSGTLSCDATLIPPIRTEANLTSQFTLTVTVNATFDYIALTASLGTMTVTAVKTATITGEITAVCTVLTSAIKRTGIVAVLNSQGFVLTVGSVINIDPYTTLRITPESRLLVISSETRTIRIRPESRTITIEGYQ